MKGFFLDVRPEDLRPYDILGEGRGIRMIHWGWHSWLEVGSLTAAVEVIELTADDSRCLWRPHWEQLHSEDIPQGTVRVWRGDLPGYFCEAEPAQRGPCSSGRCPLRLDGTIAPPSRPPGSMGE